MTAQLWRWLLLAASASLLVACGAQLPPDAQARELRAARLVPLPSDGASAPLPPQAVTLPDPWEASAPGRRGGVRYQLELPDAALQSPQSALYIPRIGNAFQVQLNGQPLLSAGIDPSSAAPPLPDMDQATVLLPLPRALLQEAHNQVDIDVIGAPQSEAGVSTVWVGPLDELEPLHRALANHQVRGVWVVGAAAVVMGTLALLLAWRTSRYVYAWFGAASLLWAGRVSGVHGDGHSAWTAVATVLFHASYGWFVVLMSLYALAAVGAGGRRSRWLLGGWAVAVLVLSAAGWKLDLPVMRSLVLGGSLCVVACLLWVLGRTAWRDHSSPAVLLTAAALIGLAVGLRDFWVFRVDHDYGAVTWSRYTILLLLGVLAWLLVDEFTRSSAELRMLNRELKDRVAAKERALQAAFEGTRDAERQQAVLAERDRILREMHDGLGGRLVAAIALTSQVQRYSAPPVGGTPRRMEEPLRELRLALDDCLVELRLALDSLETDQRPLIEALAELRFRVEPSLRAANVKLVWQIDDAASEVVLPAAATLHVLRVVREALTNVIKHAKASTVRLSLEAPSSSLVALSVVDNGLMQRDPDSGPMPLFEADPAKAGRGLANMQRRAAALGARLESAPDGEGWAVSLLLPLPVADASGGAVPPGR